MTPDPRKTWQYFAQAVIQEEDPAVVRRGAEETDAGRILRETSERVSTKCDRAACVDMWEPFRQSLEQWVPKCRIIYDKFHILQPASQAVDEVRWAEFFRKGGAARDLVRGKRCCF
jgi:transposase